MRIHSEDNGYREAKKGDLWVNENFEITHVYVNKNHGWIPLAPGRNQTSNNITVTWPEGMDRPNASAALRDALETRMKKAGPSPLFGSWLKDTKELQEEFFTNGAKFEEFTAQDLEQWHLINTYAAEDELHEAGDEISWKPWASSHFFHREAYIGELVDTLHFIANMLVAAGCTDEELTAAYKEKMDRNRKRQEEGYTGLDKCSKCGRAADDVVAHGGIMKDWVSDTDHPTVHSTGYGCNACFCDPGDDWK